MNGGKKISQIVKTGTCVMKGYPLILQINIGSSPGRSVMEGSKKTTPELPAMMSKRQKMDTDSQI